MLNVKFLGCIVALGGVLSSFCDVSAMEQKPVEIREQNGESVNVPIALWKQDLMLFELR